MKQALKQIIPLPLWQFTRNTYDGLRRIPELPAAYFHPWRRESIRRLAALKDIHKGKRAFIIGNGPSLKHLLLLSFQEVAEPDTAAAPPVRVERRATPVPAERVAQLERVLACAKESLQATIEEQQEFNEELQSSNE